MKPEEREPIYSDDDRISIEATRWVSVRDKGFTADDQDAFFEWLAADPRHSAMYRKRLDLWEEMNLLTDWRPEHSGRPNPDLLAIKRKSSKRRPWMTLGAAAILLVAIGIGISFLERPIKEKTRMLAFGGAQDYESYDLDDGSVVELNQGAQVSVQYSKDERVIFLHTGEAHFTVKKDLNRPFLVRAGDAEVLATGTAFNVSLVENGIEVLVTEGRVEVKPSLVESDETILETDGNPSRELIAGQRSLVTNNEAMSEIFVEAVSLEEIDRRLAWKGEVLDFFEVPLSEVVHEFNSRNRTQIVIADSQLQKLKITAKLRSSNLDQFVDLLEVTMSISANRDENYNIVLRMSAN